MKKKSLSNICMLCFICFMFATCDSSKQEKSNELILTATLDPRYNLYIIENDTAYYSTSIDYNYDNVDYQICKGNEKFAINALRDIANVENGNSVFSPYAMSLTYSMMINGSSKEEEKEARDYLGIDEQINTADNNEYYQKTIHEINKEECVNKDSKSSTSGLISSPLSSKDIVYFSNKIWINKQIPIKRSFISSINQYAMGASGVNFDSNEGEINAEMVNYSDNNNASIKFGPDKGGINSIVTSSMRFNMRWNYKYDIFKSEQFYNNRTEVVECEKFGFEGVGLVYDNQYYIVELPYRDSDYSMYVIYSPNQNDNYGKVLLDINNQGGLSSVIGKMKEVEVYFKMPSFTIESSFPLIKSSNSKCPKSFSNVSDQAFTLDNVYQTCSITVDNRGTSAMFDISDVETTLPPLRNPNTPPDDVTRIDVNSPFMFVIRNNKLATILFSGYVSKL